MVLYRLLLFLRLFVVFFRRLVGRFPEDPKTRLAAVLSLPSGTNLTNCDADNFCTPLYPGTRKATRPLTNRTPRVLMPFLDFRRVARLVVLRRGIKSESVVKRVARPSVAEKFKRGLEEPKVMSA
jgi:hypothetical protein